MKKTLLFTIIGLLFSVVSWSQIITSNPAFVTKDYNGVIEITYDATLGTAGLKDYTGADGVFAHTGVITNLSTSDTDWKHAPTWGDNSAKYQLTSLGNNKWKLLITPNMTAYYGLTTGEVVKKLAFVFRNGLKTKEGKDGTVGAPRDILLTVYDAGLNVGFTNPAADKAVTVNTTETITFTSSITANLELFINGSSVATAPSATTLSKPYTYSETKDYQLIAKATAGAETKYDTVNVCVPAAPQTQTRPAGTQPGINYIDGSTVTLVLYAPGKGNVFVLGEFNNWIQLNAFQMKKDGDYFWTTLSNLTPGHIYGFQYLVDGAIRISDPYAEMVLDPFNDKWINEKHNIYPNLKAYPEGKTEGLVATFQTNKPAYNWEVPNFQMHNRDNMVIYELLLRDFTVEKSLEAAIAKLDYLKTLGITAVELMPIQEFDGNNSWGYNPNHYFAPDKAYGSPEMYKKFIDECHKRGMAVILDIVLNHATGIHPYAKLWWNSSTSKTSTQNPYFNVDAPHPYSVFHDFNHTYAGTKDMFKRMVQYWITEYKVDGYRLDLTKGFTQTSSTEATASNYDQSRIDNITEYYNAAKAVKSDVMFILEHFCADNEETQLAYKGMYLWRNVNNAYSQSAMGYQSSSDFSRMNAGPRNWVGYAESHDEERNFFKAKAFGTGNLMTDSLARVARVPLNIAFTTLIPGPKMIWQFGEMGYDYSIDSNGGRVDAKPSAWSYLNIAHRKAAYDASSKIISLRRLYPDAFTTGAFSLQIAEADWNAGRRIALTHADLNMVVLGNFRTDAGISANPTFQKTGTWYELLSGETLQVTNTTMAINIPTGGLKIYTDRKIIFNTAVDELEVNTDCEVYPTTTEGRLFIATDSELKAVKIYDLQGALQIHLTNKKEIDIDQLNNGLYLMEVTTNKAKSVHKIIKK